MKISEIMTGNARLDELQGVKSHMSQTFNDKGDVYRYLKSKGFTVLGTGVYGAAFDHPSFGGRYILKVFVDRNYELFLDWVFQQGGGNPHLPKIVGKVMRLNNEASMVRVERLQELPFDEYKRLYARRIQDVLNYPNKFPQTELDKLVPYAEREGILDLYRTLIDISKARPSGAYMDLGQGNLMKRGNTIVITDPYSGARPPFQS